MSHDHSFGLMDAQGRAVAFVTITGTDLDDGVADAVSEAVKDAADAEGVEAVGQ